MAHDKLISSRKVERVLRRLGFTQSNRGDGTGHSVWVNDDGKTIRPPLRHKDISLRLIHPLTQHLETLGVCNRSKFNQMLREA